MIIGIGFDLVETDRIEDGIRRFGARFVQRIFTEAERAYCESKTDPAPHFAARFAAKEACAKALGSGIAQGIRWLDIEIKRHENGQPTLNLQGRALECSTQLGVTMTHVTLTHTKGHAAAMVALER